ncbi:hypothetical protein Bca4012_094915 [Brassica carinata]|uniref:(rape) hypothetical protein n=1 Tax=Brassica napus TaxID=3708 RepID=A0A816UQ24_BRANA|nr:unnamed protein product [Brassica napus]
MCLNLNNEEEHAESRSHPKKNEATKHLIHLPCLTPSIGEHPSTSVEISSNTLEFLEAEGIQKPNHYEEPASFIFKEKATEL